LNETIAPHGGRLVNRLASAGEAAEWQGRLGGLPSVRLNNRQISDLEMIATGGLSPLTGFMGEAEYRGVVEEMHLPGGRPWTIPVTLAVSRESAGALKPGQAVARRDEGGTRLAGLQLREKCGHGKQREASQVYRTPEEAHPGVAAVYAQGDTLLSGEVTALRLPQQADFPQYRLAPAQTREEFARRSWKRVVGFQTRNPVHRAHEYIQKCALETVDGLLLHPLVGETKGDDISAEVRMRCYEVLLKNYYPAARVVLAVNPAAMRYAGPREAIFHAIVRKNYGCTHFIVGRDHAGVGNYYGTYDAQKIFDEFDPARLGITPLFFDHTFFCKTCDAMASAKTCPHDASQHVALSGTRVRAMLAAGEVPPPQFSRPEVARVLIEAMRSH